jgi:OOP family OmpA-OmpF porin
MSRQGFVALLTASAFLVSGCASMSGTRGALDDANLTCVILGGLLGGAAGAVAANSNHGEDEDDEAVAGGAIGLVLGAVLGGYLCGSRTRVPPTARITCEPRSGEPPLQVSFRGTSPDTDREITSYAWDFGDGGRSSDQHATHVYRSPGSYTSTLTVTDDDGLTGTASCMVQVSAPAPPPAESRRIVLRGINFDFDSAQIKPEFEPVLDVAVQELQDNPTISVEVAGHTDSTGADEYNQGLSERRANSVVDYLVSKGVDRSRLSSVGHGESQPVADNSSADGRAQNRRVELNVR